MIRQRRMAIIATVLFALGCLTVPGSAPAAMKVVAVTLPLPPDGETQPLRGLAYGGDEWKVAITSIRYQLTSEEGADPVLSSWTVTATSTRPATQKVILMVFLEDERGKRLDGESKTLFIKFGEEAQEFTLDMKVDRGKWERARSLRVQASFTVR